MIEARRVRRVVTGHDAAGKAVLVSDEAVDAITVAIAPGNEFHHLWGADRPPRFPDAGAMPEHKTYFPPLGGFRFHFFSVPPEVTSSLGEGLDIGEALAEMEAKLPGLAAHMEPEDPGMHTTATIDFEVVLEGEPSLELDDGKEVRLGPGDTVVQNGTRHRWRNHSSAPARLAVFMVGTHNDRAPTLDESP